MPEQICFIEIDYPKQPDRNKNPSASLHETKEKYIERVIKLLDEYCRHGWKLALEHEDRIAMLRRAHYLMLDKPIVVQMTPEDGVLFRMFAEGVIIRNSCIRDRMHVMARFSAGNALGYRGLLHGFPVELLHENARNWLNREVSTALLNNQHPNYASIPDLPSGYAGSWPCWN